MMDVRCVCVCVCVCESDCASVRSAMSSLLGNTLRPPCQREYVFVCEGAYCVKVHMHNTCMRV